MLLLLSYWKYFIIVGLTAVCYILYVKYHNLQNDYAIAKETIQIQQASLKNIKLKELDHLKAIDEKIKIINQLEEQIKQLDFDLTALYEQDEQAKSWAEEEYNQTVINKVVNTPIKLKDD
jgi:hypothetical protein